MKTNEFGRFPVFHQGTGELIDCFVSIVRNILGNRATIDSPQA